MCIGFPHNNNKDIWKNNGPHERRDNKSKHNFRSEKSTQLYTAPHVYSRRTGEFAELIIRPGMKLNFFQAISAREKNFFLIQVSLLKVSSDH